MINMKLNKKGTSIIELLVSVVIISLVLTFILQLYVRIRGAYLMNSVNLQLELSKSVITDAVMKDFINYNVSIDFNDVDKHPKSKIFTFKDDNDELIYTKKLFIDSGSDASYYDIKYCEYNAANNTTSNCVVRRYSSDDINEPKITYSSIWTASNTPRTRVMYKFNINIVTVEGDDYSIKLYCPLNLDTPVQLQNN